MGIELQLFLGYLQNKEIKYHLLQSTKWKQDQLLHLSTLKEIHWNAQDYIGLSIPSFLSPSQILDLEMNIKNQLQVYCPKLNLDRYSPFLFSQLFIH